MTELSNYVDALGHRIPVHCFENKPGRFCEHCDWLLECRSAKAAASIEPIRPQGFALAVRPIESIRDKVAC
jgi:hypothetical protein